MLVHHITYMVLPIELTPLFLLTIDRPLLVFYFQFSELFSGTDGSQLFVVAAIIVMYSITYAYSVYHIGVVWIGQ